MSFWIITLDATDQLLYIHWNPNYALYFGSVAHINILLGHSGPETFLFASKMKYL